MQTNELPSPGWDWVDWALLWSFWCHRSRSRLLQELCDGGAAGASAPFNSFLSLSLSLSLSIPSSHHQSLPIPLPATPLPLPLSLIPASIQSTHKQLDKNDEKRHNSEHLLPLCECLRFDFPILLSLTAAPPPASLSR